VADCCPFCGAELSFAAERCRDCNLSQDPGLEPALPADDSIAEVAYEVSDWPVGSRLRLTGMLAERGIPWRWEPVLNLVVREEDDVATEAALDEIEAEELGGGDIGADVENEGDSAGDDDDDEFDEGEDEEDDDEEGDDEADGEDDDGAVAQAAMADLFVAADRLMHEPDSLTIAVDLDTAADVINASPAPFGIDDDVWSTIRRQAAEVRAALDAPDEPHEPHEPDERDDSGATAIPQHVNAGADIDSGDDDVDAGNGSDVGEADEDLDALADALIVDRAQVLRDTLRPWV
jgi:hypothetical protein